MEALLKQATQAEAEAGSDNKRRMTPLRTAQAIAALGPASIAIASQAEAEAGTDAAKRMTAQRTNQAIAKWGHAPDVILEDQKTSGTDGGTATTGSWQTRTLNTAVRNVGSLAALASNQFTLPAGTYHVLVAAPARRVDHHQARLQNITDAATVAVGTGEFSGSGVSPSNTPSIISTVFTIAGSKTFEVQHNVATTKATDGYGIAVGRGVTEVYSRVEITKVA